MTPDEEERGWEALRERWTDDEAHRAWLAGFEDLEGLARAGRRYAAALAVDPADAVAARWRDEIVKRATVHGLAQLPRSPAPHAAPRWIVRAGIALAGALAAYGLWAAVDALLAVPRARPR